MKDDDVILASKELIEFFSSEPGEITINQKKENQIMEKISIGNELFKFEILSIKIDEFNIDATLRINKNLFQRLLSGSVGKNIKFLTLLPDFSNNHISSIEIDNELKARIIAVRIDS